MTEFGDQPAGALARVDGQANVAEPLAARFPFTPQLLQALDAAFVARAPGLDALADPDFLLCPEPVELAVGHRLFGQLFRLAPLVRGVIARIRAQQAPVEFDDARRDAVEERAIVRDDDRGRPREQQGLQPLDALDVEVIRRLVEQQQLRFQRQRRGQRRALALTAGHSGGRRRSVDSESVQVFDQPGLEAPAGSLVPGSVDPAPVGKRFADRGGGRQFRFLADRDDAQARGLLQFAIVERKPARNDLEQRRLAGAVSTDEADALARFHREIRAIEQRVGAERKFGAQKRERRHDCGLGNYA